MDNRIRKNERCIAASKECNYVFASTRSCFIGYGFEQSPMEMALLKAILKNHDIAVSEAGSDFTPGQYAFCTKICAKIITSQFCIILLNGHYVGETYVPNANVNMEYGLALGFNKYVVPFQKEGFPLPFNVSGLDTVVYTERDFERKAAAAIEHAVKETSQGIQNVAIPDEDLLAFFLSRNAVVANINTPDEKNIFDLGNACGFKLLNDFTGFSYIYCGLFANLRPQVAIWRLEKLLSLLVSRFGTLRERLGLGFINEEQMRVVEMLVNNIRLWVFVATDSDKDEVSKWVGASSKIFPIEVFSLSDVRRGLGVSA